MIGHMLRHPANSTEKEIAVDRAAEILERIAAGEDPTWVIAGGDPHRSNHYAESLVKVIDIRKEVHGWTTHAAIKSVCEDWPGDYEFEQVRSVYNRFKKKNSASNTPEK